MIKTPEGALALYMRQFRIVVCNGGSFLRGQRGTVD